MRIKTEYPLVGVLIATLIFSNFSLACTEKSTQEVTMEVKTMATQGVAVPQKILEELKEVTQEVIKTHLSADYSKSWKIVAETKVLSKAENLYHCESIVTFLYEKTFTAVLLRVEFDYLPAQIKKVKVQRDYVPPLERSP
jgi:hypothetical protein